MNMAVKMICTEIMGLSRIFRRTVEATASVRYQTSGYHGEILKALKTPEFVLCVISMQEKLYLSEET